MMNEDSVIILEQYDDVKEHVEFVKSFYSYYEVLYSCNQKLLQLVGVDAINHSRNDKLLMLEIIDNIPRLIPYVYDKNKDDLVISPKDGLMEFANKKPLLDKKYNDILNNYKNLLKKIKDIRNKFEHKLHDVKVTRRSSGSIESFTIEFSIDKGSNNIEINCDDLVNLFKVLNSLFDDVSEECGKYSLSHNKTNILYDCKYTSLHFKDFNEIYDSGLKKKIGRIMNDF